MTILSRLVLVSLLLGGLCLSAAAQGPPAGDGDARAIKAVISMQMSALRRDDAEAAFSHAAPNVRRKFGTAKRFMKMVRTAYTTVYRPKRVVFAKLHIIDGKGIQQVNPPFSHWPRCARRCPADRAGRPRGAMRRIGQAA